MSEKIQLRDAWETDGNCEMCRRKDYCSKQCTRNKRRTNAMIHNMIAEKTGMGTILNQIHKEMEKIDG